MSTLDDRPPPADAAPATEPTGAGRDRWSTHEVVNQPPPLINWDVADHPALLEGVRREGAGWYVHELHRLGRLAGGAQAQRWGRDANASVPQLHTHDRFGRRIDEVEYHPAYHRLLEVSVGSGLAGGPWNSTFAPSDAAPGSGHVARAAGFFAWSHTDVGHGCPVSMTYAAIPALRREPELAREWEPLLTAPRYDPELRPRNRKHGLLAGMAMTEKQGGSDVRANTTTAAPAADGSWRLIGHKWFCSAPMSDVFLTLAHTAEGLTCFLVPRVLPDGTRNPFRIQRLKDKLGNRSNASSEIEFTDTLAWRVGPEGRGVAVIIEMVAATRVDCVTSAASLTRHAVAQAVHHVSHRAAFGRVLREQPLMANVVADLAVESEAMTAVMLRLAGAFGRGLAGDERERLFARLAVPVAKYWVTKRSVAAVAEASECLGGNGYVEDSGMPLLYRETPLNSIWEGSGNVQALDMLRAAARSPESVDAVLDEVGLARGGDRRLDAAIDALGAALADREQLQFRARGIAGLVACVLQGALLVRHAPTAVADAFCATRLGDVADGGGATSRHMLFGTLPRGAATDAVIRRAAPAGA
jgi:putative acyl-CoA dehydrogenase